MSLPTAGPHAPSSAAWVRQRALPSYDLPKFCRDVAERGGRLVAMWAAARSDTAHELRVAVQDRAGMQVACVPIDGPHAGYPSIADVFPAADRMQRALYDLSGIRARGGDERAWLRHGAWAQGVFPLADAAVEPTPAGRDDYPFVRVAGDGVHEIAVGPVHAGVIEPGHFRFSVVGEKVLRLEERLGYVHKGIEKRFEGLPLLEGAKLAARICGDSAVAFAWAYCAAVEDATRTRPPPRASWLRALMLERERIANHLGDLGALGNDAGFGFGLTQFSRLKEDLLRANVQVFGARYLFDAIVPGGVRVDLGGDEAAQLLSGMDALARDLATLREIYDNHAGLQDRFLGAGQLRPELAARLGVIGLAGRASGQGWDLRCDLPQVPYDRLGVQRVVRMQGDVAARVAVRFDEIAESLRLCKALLGELPAGDLRATPAAAVAGADGYGFVEGWRGPVFVALTAAVHGGIARCHPHDPSWQNWPALEHAIIGNIVPDFPLINKSFNLAYSGHDL